MRIAPLQFITVDHPELTHAEQAIRAYRAGCKWVQLRMKEATEREIEEEISKILPVANAHNAVLLVNDHPELALRTQAHGVHLGKMDMSPAQARELLGDNKIIGGTANTLEDIIRLAKQGVDYIGLGPYQFTTTKKNLSPTLGLEGYQKIFDEMKKLCIHIPVVAIGGITLNDITPILESGAYGIALAGAIIKDNQIEDNIKSIAKRF
jgi:thiamine-phosphate pyrophosphorylase